MTRAAGPSGIDAKSWRQLCTVFKTASADLCHFLALLAKRISTSYLDPKVLFPFLACRLIALNKNPGIRPIWVCETARRIVSKAILFNTRWDIQDDAGFFQLYAGQIAGAEAAVHATREAFADENTQKSHFCIKIVIISLSFEFMATTIICINFNIILYYLVLNPFFIKL